MKRLVLFLTTLLSWTLVPLPASATAGGQADTRERLPLRRVTRLLRCRRRLHASLHRHAGLPHGGPDGRALHGRGGVGVRVLRSDGPPTTSGEGTLMIVSVASWGDAICRSNDRTQRIDIASVLASSRSSG